MGFLVHAIAVSCTHQFKLFVIRACHSASLRSIEGPFMRSAVRCKVALGRLSRISVSTPSAIERSASLSGTHATSELWMIFVN